MSRIFSSPGNKRKSLAEDPELAMALSQIEHGCVPHHTAGECVMIFKETPEKIAFLRDAREISTEFVLVEKQEFPSVSMDIKIKTGALLNMRYQYFFLTESPEETFFLDTMAKRGRFFLLFLCGDGELEIAAEMTERERELLESALERTGSGAGLTRRGL